MSSPGSVAPTVDQALEVNRRAVEELIEVANGAEAHWATPRAPGKWSPAQVVEHVARSLEQSAHVVAGRPSDFPTLPSFLRPLVRMALFKRVLKKGAFPRAKTFKPFDPEAGPGDPAEGAERLRGALGHLEEECRTRAAEGRKVESGVFGPVSVEDYARFQALHVHHHVKQISPEMPQA